MCGMQFIVIRRVSGLIVICVIVIWKSVMAVRARQRTALSSGCARHFSGITHRPILLLCAPPPLPVLFSRSYDAGLIMSDYHESLGGLGAEIKAVTATIATRRSSSSSSQTSVSHGHLGENDCEPSNLDSTIAAPHAIDRGEEITVLIFARLSSRRSLVRFVFLLLVDSSLPRVRGGGRAGRKSLWYTVDQL